MSLPGNPYAFWPLDDNTGNGVYREAASGLYTLTGSGSPTGVPGRPGVTVSTGAARLNGTSGILVSTAINSPPVDFSTGFEMSGLVYLDTLTVGGGGAGVGGYWYQNNRIVIYYAASRFNCIVYNGGSGYQTVANTFGPPAAGQWYAIRAKYDPTSRRVGINVENTGWDTALCPIPPGPSATSFTLGNYNGLNFFPGRLQAWALYPAVLNTTDGNAVWSSLNAGGVLPAPLANLLICDGNSLTRGPAASDPATKSYPALVAAQLGASWEVYNFGVDGQTTEQMLAKVATLVDPHYNATRVNNIMVAWEGTGSINKVPESPAAAYSALTTYIAGRKAVGFRVVVMTCTPVGGPTAVAHPTLNQQQQQYNALIMANTAGADVVIDLTTDARLADPTNLTYFQSDGQHLTDAGYAVVAALVSQNLTIKPPTVNPPTPRKPLWIPRGRTKIFRTR